MSKLLFDSPPLLVNTALAEKIGLNESIVLQQIHYWLEKKRELKDKQTYKEGYYWVYNSFGSWQEQFPFWSKRTIRRIFKKLISENLLIVDTFNKLGIDRTRWYRIDYYTLKMLDISPCGQNCRTIRPDWPDHMDNVSTPLPETTTEITSEITKKKNTVSDFTEQKSDDIQCPSESRTRMDLEEYISSSSPGKDIIPYVRYFIDTYKSFYKRNHPPLSAPQWTRVFNKIDSAEYYDQDRVDYIELPIYKLMVRKYFNTKFNADDKTILHFISGNTRYFLYQSLDGSFI